MNININLFPPGLGGILPSPQNPDDRRSRVIDFLGGDVSDEEATSCACLLRSVGPGKRTTVNIPAFTASDEALSHLSEALLTCGTLERIVFGSSKDRLDENAHGSWHLFQKVSEVPVSTSFALVLFSSYLPGDGAEGSEKSPSSLQSSSSSQSSESSSSPSSETSHSLQSSEFSSFSSHSSSSAYGSMSTTFKRLPPSPSSPSLAPPCIADFFLNAVKLGGALHAFLTMLPSLTTLRLESRELDDDALVGLGDYLASNRSLTDLDIESVAVGAAGSKHFCKNIITSTALQRLALTIPLDNEAAAALSESLRGNCLLKELHLTKLSIESERAGDIIACLEHDSILEMFTIGWTRKNRASSGAGGRDLASFHGFKGFHDADAVAGIAGADGGLGGAAAHLVRIAALFGEAGAARRPGGGPNGNFDNNGSTVVSTWAANVAKLLMSNNRSLQTLTLMPPSTSEADHAIISRALVQNTTLDTLYCDPVSNSIPMNTRPHWVPSMFRAVLHYPKSRLLNSLMILDVMKEIDADRFLMHGPAILKRCGAEPLHVIFELCASSVRRCAHLVGLKYSKGDVRPRVLELNSDIFPHQLSQISQRGTAVAFSDSKGNAMNLDFSIEDLAVRCREVYKSNLFDTFTLDEKRAWGEARARQFALALRQALAARTVKALLIASSNGDGYQDAAMLLSDHLAQRIYANIGEV
jgi:hypothetical protein